MHEAGNRQAIGVVVPFDMELDRELWRWVPDGADLLITRTPRAAQTQVTVEFAKRLSSDADLEAAVRAITAGRVRQVAYACTSASFVGGARDEARIRSVMRDAGAASAVTASGALREALGALGVGRVSVVTPYVEPLTQKLVDFLGEHGIGTVHHRSMGSLTEIWEISYEDTERIIREADRPDAEAIVVSCTNLATYDLIVSLEQELGKPIVSANQATMWAALRGVGLRARGESQALLAHP